MRVGRIIAALALTLWGAFALLGAVPQIASATRSLLESAYRLSFEPFDLRAALLGTAFLISGLGSLFNRRWALWLGSVALVAEAPFGVHAGAWGLLRGVASAGTVSVPPAPTLLYFVFAFVLVGLIIGLLVWLLRPWAPTSMSPIEAA